MHAFKGTLITSPTLEGVRPVLRDHEVMIVTILDALLERFERNRDYPFIDAKLNIITGADFTDAADPSRDFRGKSAVFSWIQGRGLEALVGHVQWLPNATTLTPAEKDDRTARLTKMIRDVFERMERNRARNAGRLHFTMTPEGEPFEIDDSGRRRPIHLADAPTNFSDLFYAKGMLAAASFLGLTSKVEEAKTCFRKVAADIANDRLVSDQVQFDPKNKVRPVPGRFSHGPRMIAIGGCSLFASLTNEEEWFETGVRFIRHILEKHVNFGQLPELELHDYFEFIDGDGRPWKDGDKVLSDPGHAVEFIGLASKLLLLLRARKRKSSSQERLLARCVEVFPSIFLKNFENGFNRRIGGICKALDLISRQPVNSDMPWWNLPEAIRAGAELLLLSPDSGKNREILSALADCSNGFFTRFVNPRVHLMAYQTIDDEGKPREVIPATPDADPGYHTGLSIIDFLDCFRRLLT
jgi:mannose/cellobiose epimerase-like protein (N-acyl-D-glucosamine 2-epimerase family)